ncbi:coiled-coil domain-containing protein 127-like [Clarias gariepinus]|uniref:coiled-coil domain-containing protein 127-like n=1 Tax=Clarias gariepinus TaxID=13013 RepID=UPI00234D7B33|nr:coiled-coil domain-containing protein 127-like [Clarias gariepinus]
MTRKALAIQTQKGMEMRSQLQKECMELEEEKKHVLQIGAAGFRAALQQEDEQQQKAQVLLQKVKHKLVERHNAYCSFQVPRKVLEMENDLLLREAKDPAEMELGLEDGIRDIFKNDGHCTGMEDMAGRNGKLMWLYLKHWRLQVMVQKHRRAEDRLKGHFQSEKK